MEGCGEGGASLQRFRRSSHVALQRIAEVKLAAGKEISHIQEVKLWSLKVAARDSLMKVPTFCSGMQLLFNVVLNNCMLVRQQAVENWSYTLEKVFKDFQIWMKLTVLLHRLQML